MANNKQVKIGIGFDVDKNSLKELESIQDQLRSISAWGSSVKGTDDFTKGLKEAGQTASKLYDILEKSYSANLGTVNVTKFKQELDKAGISVKTMRQDLAKAGTQGNAAFASLGSALLNTNVQLKKSNTLLDKMAQSMSNTVTWGITSSIFNNITNSVQDAFHYVKQLDSSLNDIRIVTDKSAESMAKFAVQANNAAKNLGASTRDYTDASLIYYQQGLGEADVAARAETTLKAANVTGQSTAEVSQQLTAVWNGYKVSAEEAELYVDKLAAVAATTASDLEELSTGMSKVASAANLMGVDVDSLNAQLATIVSVTRQAPESVGTALKTIYARMGDIEAGVDTETTLGNYTAEMEAMGFNVLDANGKLRDMSDVIEEIGNKWTTLSREQQIALSQTMAGTRQYNNLLSLFDNWDMYTEAMETSANAAGTLQKQQDIYMESTAAHLQQLSTSAEDLYDTFIKPEEINAVIDVFRNGTDVLGAFFDTFGGGVKSMAAGAVILSSVFSKQIGEGLINFQKKKYQEQNNLDIVNMKKGLVQQKINETGGTAEERAEIAGYNTEVRYAEKILKLKNGITNEDYEQMTAIQARIGALKKEEELYKNIAFQKIKSIKSLNLKEKQKVWSGSDDEFDEIIQKLNEQKQKMQSEFDEEDFSSRPKDEAEAEARIAALDEEIQKLKEIRKLRADSDSTRTKREADEVDFEAMEQNAQKAAELNNSITAVTSSMTALFSIWGAISSLGSIWNDEDLSTGEKLIQTFITLGAVLPMVTIAMKKFKEAMGDTTGFGATFNKVWGTLIKKLAGDATVAASGATVAANGATVAANGATGALAGLGTTLSSLAAVILPVVAVVGVLTAAFVAVYNEATKYERAAKKASETHESLKTSAEEAKTKVENLKNAFNEYDTVTNTLDQCVKGTKEWNDALEKANNQVLAMLNQFPELLKMEGAVTRNAEGLLVISKSAEDQIKANAEKQKETLDAASLLSGVDAIKAQNEYDASSIIKENSISVVTEDFTQKTTNAGAIPGLTTPQTAFSAIESFNFYDEASSILLDDIDKLTGLTETELESQLRESLSGLKETYNISDLAFENMIKNLRGAQEEIEKLGQNASKADIALENIGNNLAAEELQGYSDTVQEIASESFEKNYLDKQKEIMDLGTKDVAGWSREATNKDIREVWTRYNEAMGTNFSLVKDAVKGSDENRTFHYKDEEGKKQEVTLEQMASTIAASEALKEMGSNASDAANALKNLQTEVGNNDIYEGLENFIATKGSFGSMNRNEFEQLQNSVNEAEGAKGYLKSIGIKSDEDAVKYGFKDMESLISAFENGLKNMDFDGLVDEMYKPVQDAYKQQMNNISTLSFDAQTSLIDSMNQAYELAGQEGLNSFANIFNKMEANGEAEEFATALNSIDWSTANVENVEKALKDAGVETAFTADEIRGLISSMDSTGTSVSELNEAFATMKDILDGLATGNKITKEEFDKIGSTLGEEFQGYFTPMLDGTYKLIGAAEDFKEAVNQSLLDSALESKNQLGEKINQDQAFLNRGWEDLSKTRTLSSDDGYVQDQAGVNAQLDFLKEYGSDTSLPTRTWRIGLEEGSLTQEDLDAIAEAVTNCEGAYGNLESELATIQEQFNQLDLAIALSKTNLEDLKTSLQNGEISGQAYTQAAYQMDLEQDTDSLDTEEWDAYAEHLQEIAKDSDDLSDSLEDNEDAAKIVAKGIMKMNDAIETLSKNFDDWNEILSDDSAKATEEYAEAMDEARGTVADLLDISKDFVSDDFVAEHLEEIGKAAEGDADAIDSLKSALADDVMGQILLDNSDFITNKEEVLNQYESLKASMPDVKAGVTLDGTDNFVAGLNELISSTGMTVDQVNALCDTLGFEAAYETNPQTTHYSVPEYTTETEIVDTDKDGNPTKTITHTYQSGTYAVNGEYSAFAMDVATEGGSASPKISGLTKKASGASANKSSSPRKGGGGGGGGSKKGQKAEKQEKFKADIDPFHEVNEQIDLLNTNLDRLAKKQEKAFGQDLIDNLKEQDNLLKKQNKNLQDKIKITEKEIAQNKYKMQNLKVAGKKAEISFNEDGSIANYDEALSSAEARVNKLVSKYNKIAKKEYKEGSKGDKNRKKLAKNIEKAKEDYSELQKLMDGYDEYLVSKEDLINQVQDNIDQIVENNVTIFTTAIEVKLEVRDAKVSYNNFLNEWNSLTAKQPVKLKVDTDLNNANIAKDNIEDLTTMVTKTQAELATIQQGGVSTLFGKNEKLAYDTLKGYTEKLQSSLSDLQGYYQDVAASIVDAMDEVSEAMDEQISDMEFYADSLQHVINVNQKLLGESASAANNKEHYKNLVKQNNETIGVLKKNADYWKEEMNKMAGVNEEAYKTAKENYISATKEMQSALETSLENIQTALENSITSIFETFTNSLLSENWGFDNMIQDWEIAVSESETYLTNINKANQLKQLELKYQQAIDKSSSLSTQKELLALKQEELNMLKEQGRLTQYDIDRANKKLQLKLAEIALEEAQNNKSKLRLRRDSQGNYSYQYTADEDNVAEKQAEVDNLKAEMAEDDWKYFKTNVTNAIDSFSTFKSDYAEMLASGASQEELQEFLEGYAQEMTNNTDLFNDSINYLLNSTATATGQDLNKMTEEEKIAMLQEQFGEDIMTSESLSFLKKLSNNTKTAEDATNYLKDNILSLAQTEIKWAEEQKEAAGEYAGYSKDFSTMNTALEDINTEVNKFNENSKTTITNLKEQLDGVQEVFNIIKTFLTDEKVKAGLEALKKAIGTNKDANGNDVTSNGSLSAAGSDAQAGSVGSTAGTTTMTAENTDAEKIVTEQQKTNQGNTTIEKGDVVKITKKSVQAYKKVKGKNKFKKNGKANKGEYIVQAAPVTAGKSTYAELANNKWVKKESISGYDTGGYTGDWKSSEGRLAFLHQKELVLNAKDTENMLKMLDISRSMTSVISSVSNKIKDMMYQIDKANYTRNMNSRTQPQDASNQLEQNVHIEATFPNVSQSHEIEDAFNNLINIAAQRAYRNRR